MEKRAPWEIWLRSGPITEAQHPTAVVVCPVPDLLLGPAQVEDHGTIVTGSQDAVKGSRFRDVAGEVQMEEDENK